MSGNCKRTLSNQNPANSGTFNTSKIYNKNTLSATLKTLKRDEFTLNICATQTMKNRPAEYLTCKMARGITMTHKDHSCSSV